MRDQDETHVSPTKSRIAILGLGLTIALPVFGAAGVDSGDSEVVRKVLREEIASDAVNSADQGVGLNGTLTDFVSLITAYIDSVGLEEKDESLTISWNPRCCKEWNPQARFSFRSDPDVFEPLSSALTAAGETSTLAALDGGLDALDDVTVSIAISRNKGRLGRDPGKELADAIVTKLVEDRAAAEGEVTPDVVRRALRKAGVRGPGPFVEANNLARKGQVFVKAGKRFRADEVGPDALFVSINGEGKLHTKKTFMFSGSFEYSDYDDYSFSSPVLTAPVTAPSWDKKQCKLAVFAELHPLGDGLDAPNLDFVLQYVDPDDARMNERVIASLALTQRLANGASLTFGFAYASDPEFLGQVDKELTARFGLRMSLSGGKGP